MQALIIAEHVAYSPNYRNASSWHRYKYADHLFTDNIVRRTKDGRMVCIS